jgi:hypothetical protein
MLQKAGYLLEGSTVTAANLAFIIKQYVACAPKILKALANGL